MEPLRENLGIIAGSIRAEQREGRRIQQLERLQHREGDGVGLHGVVQSPVDEEAAVAVQDVHQIPPPIAEPDVHEVDVPHLIRTVRLGGPR
jgi:hypothetical protein